MRPLGSRSPVSAQLLSMLTLLAAFTSSSCLRAWDEGGPWACSAGSVCPEGFTCDD